MSASPVARQLTQSQAIPSRRILINSASDLPNDYSTTPGGTFFSTTPGGTRIVYERNVLMQLRNSPLAKTPPKNLQFIPGFSPGKSPTKISGLCENNNTERKNSTDRRVSPIAQDHPTGTDAEQFEMDL
jgi:hypothetical protein